MSEINDYLSKADKDLAKSVMYRVYGMPGPLFMNENESGDTPEPIDYSIPFYVENITEETETLTISCLKMKGDYLEFPVKKSVDGTNWESLGTTGATALTETIEPGSKLYLRAKTDTWAVGDVSTMNVDCMCSISGVSKIGGNAMSLIYGDDFTGEEKEFPENTFGNFVYIFGSATSSNDTLISASELLLPAMTLSPACYFNMFSSCTALTSIPELPATTLSWGCYADMFYKCSSLTSAPQLPATTLAENCYNQMFLECTSLVKAPELPATILTVDCYNTMFSGCTSLNEVTIYANDISANNCLNEWLSNVAETGTFHNLGTATYETGSVSGIPSGWTEVHE